MACYCHPNSPRLLSYFSSRSLDFNGTIQEISSYSAWLRPRPFRLSKLKPTPWNPPSALLQTVCLTSGISAKEHELLLPCHSGKECIDATALPAQEARDLSNDLSLGFPLTMASTTIRPALAGKHKQYIRVSIMDLPSLVVSMWITYLFTILHE